MKLVRERDGYGTHWGECSSCAYETRLETFGDPPEGEASHELCWICSSTLAGNARRHPDLYPSMFVMGMLGFLGNAVLDRVAHLPGGGGRTVPLFVRDQPVQLDPTELAHARMGSRFYPGSAPGSVPGSVQGNELPEEYGRVYWQRDAELGGKDPAGCTLVRYEDGQEAWVWRARLRSLT